MINASSTGIDPGQPGQSAKFCFFFCFRLFIVATDWPSERRPKRGLVVIGDSARIQDEITKNSFCFFNVLCVQQRHRGPGFKVSTGKPLVIIRLKSPGIEPTTSSFQVECPIN